MNRTLLALVTVITVAACSSVERGVLRTASVTYPPHSGPVQVSRTREPSGVSLGVVQVYGKDSEPIDELMAKLTRTAAELGADLVKVDRVSTRYDAVNEDQTVSYECGTDKEPKTCTQTQTTRREVATTQVLGRAFRTAP
jgi:hypothetical protein